MGPEELKTKWVSPLGESDTGEREQGQELPASRSCVQPTAFSSQCTDPPLHKVELLCSAARRNRTSEGALAVPLPSSDRHRPPLGRRVSECLPWTLPSPPSEAAPGRWSGIANCQVHGSRSRPGRAPSPGKPACCISYRRFSYSHPLVGTDLERERRDPTLEYSHLCREGRAPRLPRTPARAPRSESFPSASRISALPSP